MRTISKVVLYNLHLVSICARKVYLHQSEGGYLHLEDESRVARIMQAMPNAIRVDKLILFIPGTSEDLSLEDICRENGLACYRDVTFGVFVFNKEIANEFPITKEDLSSYLGYHVSDRATEMDTGCLFVRFVVDDGTILYAVKMTNEEYIDHRDKFVRDANRYDDAIYKKFGHHVNMEVLSDK